MPLCTLMTGTGLAVGLLVPTVFEWTEKPAARSRHTAMDRAALVVIVVTLVVGAIVWSLNRPKELADVTGPASTSKSVQFGIRHILIAMTVVALLIAIGPMIKSVSHWVVVAAGAGILGWSHRIGPVIRSRTGACLAAMFLPFVWIVSVSRPFGPVSGMLTGMVFGPGLIPALLFRTGNIDNTTWIAAVVVIVEMAIGFFLARRTGGILITAYIILVLATSTGTSLVFHGLYRM